MDLTLDQTGVGILHRSVRAEEGDSKYSFWVIFARNKRKSLIQQLPSSKVALMSLSARVFPPVPAAFA